MIEPVEIGFLTASDMSEYYALGHDQEWLGERAKANAKVDPWRWFCVKNHIGWGPSSVIIDV